MIFGRAIDRSEIAAELELIADHAGTFRNVWVEIARALRKATAACNSKHVGIFKVEVPVITVPLVFDEIDVHVDAVGSRQGRASLQLFAAAVSSRNRFFLLFRTEVVILKQIVTAG